MTGVERTCRVNLDELVFIVITATNLVVAVPRIVACAFHDKDRIGRSIDRGWKLRQMSVQTKLPCTG